MGKKMLPPLAPNPRVCAGRKRMLAQLDRIWFDTCLRKKEKEKKRVCAGKKKALAPSWIASGSIRDSKKKSSRGRAEQILQW